MSLQSQLAAGIAALGLEVSAEKQKKLLDYLALLQKWNRTYNLTAIRDAGEMVTQHLLDSLAVLPGLQKSALAGRRNGVSGGQYPQQRWADVGSGAGLPGIPLAIVRPELDMSLIETVEKKSAFQRQAKIELGLSNVSVVQARVESMADGGFDAVISRAFADIADFLRLAGHLLATGGRLYAMKGLAPEEELRHLPSGWAVLDSIELQVPGLAAARHLIVIERA